MTPSTPTGDTVTTRLADSEALTGWRPYHDFDVERHRAHAKHKDKLGGSMEMKSYDEPDWLAVVVEEVGEVAKVLCDHRHGLISDDELPIRLREELVQVGAMTAAWVVAIDAAELT